MDTETIIRYIKVKPDLVETFVSAMQEFWVAAREESDCLHFDLVQEESDVTRFVTYEVYQGSALRGLKKQSRKPRSEMLGHRGRKQHRIVLNKFHQWPSAAKQVNCLGVSV